MDRQSSTPIIVAGTGPVGLIAALALAQTGFDVQLVGPPAREDDRRTTALMAPSLDFLGGLGVGERLRDEPVLGQRLLARRRRHHLLARLARLGVVVELDAPAAEEEPVGVRRRRRRERPVARHARLRRAGLSALPLRIARRRSGGLLAALVTWYLGHGTPRVHRVPVRSETAGSAQRVVSKEQAAVLFRNNAQQNWQS